MTTTTARPSAQAQRGSVRPAITSAAPPVRSSPSGGRTARAAWRGGTLTSRSGVVACSATAPSRPRTASPGRRRGAAPGDLDRVGPPARRQAYAPTSSHCPGVLISRTLPTRRPSTDTVSARPPLALIHTRCSPAGGDRAPQPSRARWGSRCPGHSARAAHGRATAAGRGTLRGLMNAARGRRGGHQPVARAGGPRQPPDPAAVGHARSARSPLCSGRWPRTRTRPVAAPQLVVGRWRRAGGSSPAACWPPATGAG